MLNEICTNDILYAITNKIDTIFNKDTEKKYAIITKPEEQGFEYPCFYIKRFKEQKQELGSRKQRKITFIIHYMNNNNDLQELNIISDMLECLEYITLKSGDILKAIELKDEISDGVLLFFVTYKYFTILKEEKDEEMEEFKSNGGVKKA